MTLTSSRRAASTWTAPRRTRSRDASGFDPPLASLRYWILEYPTRPNPHEELDQRQQRLQVSPAGWHIDYTLYAAVGGESLPARLTLRRDAVRCGCSWMTGSYDTRETHWPAPRETESFPHVTGRRADGYARAADALAHRPVRHGCDRVREDGGSSGGGPARGALRGGSDPCGRPGASRAPPHAPRGEPQGAAKRIPRAGDSAGASRTRRTTLPRVERDVELRALLERAGQPFEAMVRMCLFLFQGSSAWAEGIGERPDARRPARDVVTSSLPGSRHEHPGGVPEALN